MCSLFFGCIFAWVTCITIVLFVVFDLLLYVWVVCLCVYFLFTAVVCVLIVLVGDFVCVRWIAC